VTENAKMILYWGGDPNYSLGLYRWDPKPDVLLLDEIGIKQVFVSRI